jgi:Dolichyl-phosphate-mannose-protein mannosyltransferase
MTVKNGILSAFILGKFILTYLLISPVYDLHRDEYLHLDQGSHLAWGYISVPPFTSWVSYLIHLLGDGYFWIKFFPALFGALTIVLVWKTIEELGGHLFALVTGATAVLLSVMLRINILYQPNSFDIFFWTLSYFIIIKYINGPHNKWFYLLALSVGLGILSKYNIVFLLAGLLPAVLLSEQRRILFNKHFYFGIAVCCLIVLPNLLWQFNHHFPTLRQLDELNRTQLVNVKRLDFVKDQFIYFISALALILPAFFAFFFYPAFKKYRLFFWAYVFTISVFIFLKAKSYYAIGLYPIFIAFGAVYMEKLCTGSRGRYLRPALIISILLLSIPFIRIGFPHQSPEKIKEHAAPYRAFGLLRWEDGTDHELPQDFADMRGWSELAKKTDSIYSKLPDKKNTLVLCDNYGQAGAINYYSVFKNIRAVSYNADYINWIPLQEPINNIILVQNPDDDDPERKKEAPLFEKISYAGQITDPFSREKGTKIYLLMGAKVNINQLIRQEIAPIINRR